MATVIDELVTILGFDMDSQANATLAKFNAGIASITQHAKMASKAVLAASASIAYFTSKTNQASAEVEKLGRLTGISTDTIQEMSFAMEQVGGSISSMHSDLVSLLASMNSPIPGEFNQGLFLLGVSTKKANGDLKSVDDVLLDIADKMQGMSAQRQMQWGQKIGISKDTILLLQEGRGEIERLRKQAKQIPVIVDKESLKNAREFNRQMSLLGRVFDFIGKTAASVAGPAIRDLVEGLLAWISANKGLIQSGLGGSISGIIDGVTKFSKVVGNTVDAILDFIPGLREFGDVLSGTEMVAATVYGALALLSIPFAILLAKVLLVGAAMAVAGLVINDFIAYLSDGESVTGELAESVTELWEVFSQKFPAMTEVLEIFGGGLKKFAVFLKDVFFVVLHEFGRLFNIVASGFRASLDPIEEWLSGLGFGKGDKYVRPKTLRDKFKEFEEKRSESKAAPTPTPTKTSREHIEEFLKYREGVASQISTPVKAIRAAMGPVLEPVRAAVEPVRAAMEPVRAAMEPVRTAMEPVRAAMEPVRTALEPVRAAMEPVRAALTPTKTSREHIEEFLKYREGVASQISTPVKEIRAAMEEAAKIFQAPKETQGSVPPEPNISTVIGDGILGLFESAKVPLQDVKKSLDIVGAEIKKLDLKDINKNMGTLLAPTAMVPMVQNNNTSTFGQNVTNSININITGDNAPAVASEVSSTLRTTLQQIFPGGLAPAVQ